MSKMIIKNSRLAKTAFVEKELLQDDRAKIAFMGRSNVGKSSLINKVLGRKNLARTSSTPGKTLSVNYYLINEAFYFVDLPGYGYAKTSKKQAQRVKDLFSGFFEQVRNLKLILLLIDSRRGFLAPDLEIVTQMLNKNFKILTVLTKSDKIGASERLHLQKSFQDKFGLKVVSFSTKSDNKRDEILWNINKALME